jgi:hypothetical protein
MTPEDLARQFTEVMRALSKLHKEMQAVLAAQQPKPRPQTAGNIVALPRVNLEAAMRSQKRGRRKAGAR